MRARSHGILMDEQRREHQVSVDVTTRRTFSADDAVCLAIGPMGDGKVLTV